MFFGILFAIAISAKTREKSRTSWSLCICEYRNLRVDLHCRVYFLHVSFKFSSSLFTSVARMVQKSNGRSMCDLCMPLWKLFLCWLYQHCLCLEACICISSVICASEYGGYFYIWVCFLQCSGIGMDLIHCIGKCMLLCAGCKAFSGSGSSWLDFRIEVMAAYIGTDFPVFVHGRLRTTLSYIMRTISRFHHS